MSPERWQLVKRLFHDALDRTPTERPVFLKQSCGRDRALQHEVESLLNSHNAGTDFIERAPLSIPIASIESDRSDPQCRESLLGTDPPQTIGRYRINRAIAFGGMGAVYLGSRADDAYQKQVAIKLFRTDRFLDDPRRDDLKNRFVVERQTLANLDHPNIAKLLDGGSTDDGIPYLVMDYIDGQPIDEYCASRGMSIDDRLRLFTRVCGAVHYAHQHLVIHRDLKPSNILVGNDGEPRLLDFGIAKLLDPFLLSANAQTTTSFQPLTPEYASPEQVSGQFITTASDVYSLGVVLYELLTGQRPYELAGLTWPEAARTICELMPNPPSTAIKLKIRTDHNSVLHVTGTKPVPHSTGYKPVPHVTLHQFTGYQSMPHLTRRLAGDIDMIVLKALRKEPERRYVSAEQFADDVRRHLNGLPVIARPDTAMYRLSKFVRRHRAGVIAACLIVALLTGAGITTALSMREAGTQRKSAEANVNFFLMELLREATGRPDAAVRNALNQRGVKIAEAYADQPLLEAELRTTLGNAYREAGLYLEAEQHFRRALELRQKILAGNHPDLAQSMHNLGDALRHRGEFSEAKELLQRALELGLALFGEEHASVAATRNSLGHALLSQDRRQAVDAEDQFQQALDTHRLLGQTETREFAATLDHLASAELALKKFKDAREHYQQALSLRRTLFGDEHVEVASSLHNLGSFSRETRVGRDEKAAEQFLRQAFEMRRKLLGDRHPSVASTAKSLGLLLRERGDLSGAAPFYQLALEIYDFQEGYFHPVAGSARRDLASIRQAQGEHEQAAQLLQEALEIFRHAHGPQHVRVVQTLRQLAEALHRQGSEVELREVTTQILEWYRQAAQSSNVSSGDLNNYAYFLLTCAPSDMRNPSLALELATRAVDQMKDSEVGALDTLALALWMNGQRERAVETLRQALDLAANKRPRDTLLRRALDDRLIGFLRDNDDISSIVEVRRDTERLLEKVLSDPKQRGLLDEVGLSNALTYHGFTLTELAEFEEAETVLRESLAIREQFDHQDYWLRRYTESVLGRALLGQQRLDEAQLLLFNSFDSLKRNYDAPTARKCEVLAWLINWCETKQDVPLADSYGQYRTLFDCAPTSESP